MFGVLVNVYVGLRELIVLVSPPNRRNAVERICATWIATKIISTIPETDLRESTLMSVLV